MIGRGRVFNVDACSEARAHTTTYPHAAAFSAVALPRVVLSTIALAAPARIRAAQDPALESQDRRDRVDMERRA
jgi:hypothetical protein